MKYRQVIYLFTDIVLVVCSHYLATLLRFEGQIPQDKIQSMPIIFSIAIFIVVLLSFLLGCYSSIWIYIGFEAAFRQLIMSALSVAALLAVKYFAIPGISGSISVIFGILLFMTTTGARGTSRFLKWLETKRQLTASEVKRAVIVGAGQVGASFIKVLAEQSVENVVPVAAVDDDKEKIGLKINGVPVAGALSEIDVVCKTFNADEVIIAVPSASRETLLRIVNNCSKANLPVKIINSFVDMEEINCGSEKRLKEISLEDLLFRDTVAADMNAAGQFIEGKTIMITGGAGSIGSEMCRQALGYNCELLIVYDFNENGLFELNERLKQHYDEKRYTLCLGSVRDFSRLQNVMEEFRPQIVYHAAAHKHVPMMELNPFEAVKNNVMGTVNVINACSRNGVSKCMLVSTDKAVNPTSIMGATKRISELLAKNMDSGECVIAAVRFGNVLGSNGSVIPTLRNQIDKGGPVSVTHKDITRFFMTIEESVKLLLSAGAIAHGGEIFVLDMGSPIKIYDLAYSLIKMSGYEPNVDIEIKITGLRPGEKLHEELYFENESVDMTSLKKISIITSEKYDKNMFKEKLNIVLETAAEEKDEFALREAIFDLIQYDGCEAGI